jgi:glutaminyl-peptide cyclotransferase
MPTFGKPTESCGFRRGQEEFLAGLVDKRELRDPGAVLNGIAYDTKGGRFFVTGKLWPKLFEIKVIERP